MRIARLGLVAIAAAALIAPAAHAGHCGGKAAIWSTYEIGGPEPVGLLLGLTLDANDLACTAAPGQEGDFRVLAPGTQAIRVFYDADFADAASLTAVVDGLGYTDAPVAMTKAAYAEDLTSPVRSVYVSGPLAISPTASGQVTATIELPEGRTATVTYRTLL